MRKPLRFRPNGAAISQPRATPWVGEQNKFQSPEGATQSLSRVESRPFRALETSWTSLPRALPWAGLLLPLRGETATPKLIHRLRETREVRP